MDNKLVLKSISRLDLCVDFQCFENNYHPRDLIADLLSSKILYNCNSDFSLHGHTRNVAQFDSMSFGSRASNYYVTMYNKSQEMRSVKTKNYIEKLWKNNNFDMSKDTWRVEIAINNSKSCLVDGETGEAFVLNYDNLKDKGILKNYFQLLINHKFAFKINSNQKNKSRMDDVKLFNFPNFIIRSFLLCYKRDTNRSNKVFVTSLVNYIISLPSHRKNIINEYKCLLLHYITEHNLFHYYKKRFSSELPLGTLSYNHKVIYAAPDSYADDFLETCFLA
jgi:hypothetical protein